jgi:hypothetical protein
VRRYNYFDADRPTDADGFPIPKETVPEADLGVGVKITMPSGGVVLLRASCAPVATPRTLPEQLVNS